MKTMKIGDAVRPAGDGEDFAGRIIPNTKARLRVVDLYSDRVVVVVVRPGGAFNCGRLELMVSDVVACDPIPLPKPRTVAAHVDRVAEEAAFNAAHCRYLAHLAGTDR